MTMAEQTGYIWLDGHWVEWKEAKTHLLAFSLHYGMGVFEGLRSYETPNGVCLFRLQAHTDRLYRSAHIIKMQIPYEKEQLQEVQREVVNKNNLKHAYVRPICFYGAEGMGLRANNLSVHVGVAAWEWGAYLGKENLESGIRVRVSSFTRHHRNHAMCKAKITGNYINSVLAVREAMEAGCDEALLLDPQGYITEGSGENFFIFHNGTLITPQTDSCLEGITRDTVMQLAKSMNIPVIERPITRDEAYVADEAFFTGTAAEVTPIRMIDGRMIGKGSRGPITQKLQSAFFDLVQGRNAHYSHWLTPVTKTD